MTLVKNKASLLGLANGAAVTAANSGGGGQTAFDAVTLSGGGAVTYESATESMVCSEAAGGGVARVEWTTKFNADVLVVEVKLHELPGSLGGGDSGTIEIRSAGASIARLEIDDATGRLYAYASSGGSVADSGSTVVPSGSGSRLSLAVRVSTGELKARLFTAEDGESSTPAWSTSLTGQALGAANATAVRVGQNNSTPAGVVRLEHVRADDTTMDTLGAWSSTGATAKMTATARAPHPSVTAGTSATGGGPMTAQARLLGPGSPMLVSAVLAGPAAQPRSVLVNVTGMTVGDSYTVTAHAAGWSRVVQGGQGVATSTQLVLTDVATPLNSPVTYTVATDSGFASTEAVTVAYDVGDAVLSSLDGRTVAGVFWVDTGDEREQGTRVALYAVSGRTRPVVHYDVALDETGTMVVETSGQDTVALRDLVRAGAPVLLRTQVGLRDLDPVEVLTITAAPRRLVGASSIRRWDLTYALVDDDSDAPLVQATLEHVNTVWAGLTLGDVNAAWSGRPAADLNGFDWVGEAS